LVGLKKNSFGEGGRRRVRCEDFLIPSKEDEVNSHLIKVKEIISLLL
jgi:hypothetical protein